MKSARKGKSGVAGLGAHWLGVTWPEMAGINKNAIEYKPEK